MIAHCTRLAAPPVGCRDRVDIAKKVVFVAPAVVIVGAVVTREGFGAARLAAPRRLPSSPSTWWCRGATANSGGLASLNLLMTSALSGFLLRMGLLVAVISAVRHQSWVDLPVLAITLLVTQLGLLFWETKYVSATLAYPGLKPTPQKGD